MFYWVWYFLKNILKIKKLKNTSLIDTDKWRRYENNKKGGAGTRIVLELWKIFKD